MKVLNDSTTHVLLDPIEWFDVEWWDNGEYKRARVVEIKRNVYPAQGGGHGCVIFGIAYLYLKSGELAKRRETVHQLPGLVEQIPPLMRTNLDEISLFADLEED